MDLRGRSLLKETDLNADEFLFLVDLARQLRADKRQGVTGQRLAGRNIALIFEKTSTRTRSAFEVAAHDEGGHVTYLGPGESQLGHKESVKDTARVLGRMFDGIEYRGFTQEAMDTLGQYAGVPVWNGLTDTWHPTQMLADILTMTDHCSKPLAEMSFCYLGDGRNNTANSLLVTGATLGMDARICAPAALQPSEEVRGIADGLAAGRRAEGHQQPGREVHALPAGLARPQHRSRPEDLRQAWAGRAGSHRRGLRVARLRGVRWRQRRVVTTGPTDTIADGVAGRCPIPAVVGDLLLVADDAVLVSEASIIAGVRMLLDHAGLVVEPSAALGIAAILEDRHRFAGRHVVTIVCGSNVDLDAYRRWTRAAPVHRS
jgi:ornithine carbamoyltransferase